MTPIIGTILILFIVLLAMGAIMLWGVPAIQGLQDQAEFQSAVTQALQVNADIRTLRDPQNTKLSTFTMNEGTLRVEEGSRWMVLGIRDAAFNTTNITGWAADASDTLTVAGFPGTVNISVYDVDGGAQYTLIRRDCASPCLLDLGSTVPDKVLQVQLRVGSELKADGWILDIGRLSYVMRPSQTLNRVHVEMGAVFTQQGPRVFAEWDPTIKAPDWTLSPKDPSFLVRFMEMEGNTVAIGKGAHTVIGNLFETYGPNKGRPSFSDATAVRIAVDDSDHSAEDLPGLLEEAFCNYFTDQANVTQQGGACDGGIVNLLYDPDDNSYANGGRFQYELSHSVVRVIVRP